MASKRRDKGSGSVYQRSSDGLWVGYVTLPSGPDGKRRRKVVTRKRKADLIEALRKVRAELDRAGDLPTSSPTVAQWMERWLTEIAPSRLKPRTLETYEGCVRRYIVPAIGTRRLDKLTPAHVRQLHASIVGRGLSSTTALQAHRILAKALTDAEREGRVGRNVAALTDAPRKRVVERDALTAEQAIQLLQSVASDPYGPRWALGLLTGMRQGECLGLTRQAVDLEQGIITVEWAMHRLTWQHGCDPRCKYRRAGSCPYRTIKVPDWQESRHVEGALWLLRPKSLRSWRRVPMAPMLHEIMKRHVATARPSGLLWGVVDPRDDYEAWKVALDRAGLPHVPLHSLRHTASTLLYALGVPEQTRMEILGHSSATTTAGYTHIDLTMQQDAMRLYGERLDPDGSILAAFSQAHPQLEG